MLLIITSEYSKNGSLFPISIYTKNCTSHSAEVEWFFWRWGSVVVLVVGVDVSPMTLPGPAVVGALWRDDSPLRLAFRVRIGQCVLRPGLTGLCTRRYYGTFIWRKQWFKKFFSKKSLLFSKYMLFKNQYLHNVLCFGTTFHALHLKKKVFSKLMQEFHRNKNMHIIMFISCGLIVWSLVKKSKRHKMYMIIKKKNTHCNILMSHTNLCHLLQLHWWGAPCFWLGQ